tara:strand:- start:6999 stop:8438 length:1440 start_codon:yes stop_codon:yes gene_type:complete
MSGYIGNIPTPQATQTRDAFTATASQTSFATSGYSPGFLDVFLNGVKLAAADYTATNGSDVVLTTGAALNDILEVVAYTTFEAADVTGAADFTVTSSFTSPGIDDNANAIAITIDASENVGIGTTSPEQILHVKATANLDAEPIALFENDTGTGGDVAVRLSGGGTGQPDEVYIEFHNKSDVTNSFTIGMDDADDKLFFGYGVLGTTNSHDQMALDSSGNLMVGKTALATGTVGCELRANGKLVGTIDGGNHTFNRLTSVGDILKFAKDDTTVGSIGIETGGFVIDGEAGHTGLRFSSTSLLPRDNGADTDNTVNLGAASLRMAEIFAGNATINTSDRNDKQDIASLTPTEMLVAARLSTGFRNFKWKDAVTEKGAAARTHSGVIAQDIQDAFTAEGLDAGRYSLFSSDTWFIDAEGVEVEEGTEGAISKTRLGVRYSELLSFVAAYNEQRFTELEDDSKSIKDKYKDLEARLTALEGV